MFKNFSILAAIVVVVALPFIFRQKPKAGDWKANDPVLVVVTPHNEAIRFEFEQGFSRWHQAKFGKPVKIDWRNIGGTTEISRYLQSEFASNMRQWWLRAGKPWPSGMGADMLVGSKRPTEAAHASLWDEVRKIDDPKEFTASIDLFFGGGEYDHTSAYRNGLTVEPWTKETSPQSLFTTENGTALIPERLSGEIWRTATLFGSAVSTFGIVYNVDRLADLGVRISPTQWTDLADPIYFRQVGLADPTKSGSIAKAFEMIVHQQIYQAVVAAGYTDQNIATFEKAVGDYRAAVEKDKKFYNRGEIPESVPQSYQDAIERGWLNGMALVQRIGANARYFTDSAGKVPIDVSIGDAAVGMAIDFYGRYQAQSTLAPDGSSRMIYVTPAGGSSVSCDPISLLRGAPNRELATRFIEFVLTEEGQRLWTYRPGTPGGPVKFALRRLPVRRDFYPSTQPALQARHEIHRQHAADDLADATIDPYQIAKTFTYQRRWTSDHFGVQRDIIKAMCLDSADELKAAWKQIGASGGPESNIQAMALLSRLPTVKLTPLPKSPDDPPSEPEQVTLTWRNAPETIRKYDKLEISRKWTAYFRASYRDALKAMGTR